MRHQKELAIRLRAECVLGTRGGAALDERVGLGDGGKSESVVIVSRSEVIVSRSVVIVSRSVVIVSRSVVIVVGR